MTLSKLRNTCISSMKLKKKVGFDEIVEFIAYCPLTKDFIIGFNFSLWVYDAHNFALKKQLSHQSSSLDNV